MQFPVTVRASRPLPHSIISGGEALIEARVYVAGAQQTVRFLIDTGADVTVLSPIDSLRILRDDIFAIDFAHDPRSLSVMGIGGGAHHVVRDAALTLHSTEGERHSIAMPILIAEPTPPRRAEPAPLRLAEPTPPRRAEPAPLRLAEPTPPPLAEPGPPMPPSVLGRDFLRHFHLELRCGNQRRAALETL